MAALNPFTRSISEPGRRLPERTSSRGTVWLYAHPSMMSIASKITERCTSVVTTMEGKVKVTYCQIYNKKKPGVGHCQMT